VTVFHDGELAEELLQLGGFLDLGQRAIQVGGVAFVLIMVIPALVGLQPIVPGAVGGRRVHDHLAA
jgi:hypothetical protein